MINNNIVFIQRVFPHYRKSLFDELNKLYKFTLLYAGTDPTIKEEKAPYAIKVRYIKYWKKVTNVFLFVFFELFRIKPNIVVHEANPSIVSLFFVFLYCKIAKIKFVLWGHGYNRSLGFNPLNNLKSLIRLFYMKYSDAIIFYDFATKDLFSKYLDEKKLFVAINTIDTEKFLTIRKQLDLLGKNKIKKQLGFESYYNIIFLGRLIPSKKPLDAIKIFEKVKTKLRNYSINLHIIGDGPERINIVNYIKNNNLNNAVVLHGYIYDDEEISKILYLGDLVLNPGYVGLNINHAFCFSLPIFSFERGKFGPFHSPEIEYVQHGQTGFLFKPYDYDRLADFIVTYLTNGDIQKSMKLKIEHLVKDVISLSNMVQGFVSCFNYLKEKSYNKD